MNEDNIKNEWLSDLFETYYDALVLYSLSLLRGQGDALGQAEDYAQETLYRAGKEYRTLRSHPAIEGWLLLTCRHLLDNTSWYAADASYSTYCTKGQTYRIKAVFSAGGESVTRYSLGVTYQ